MRTAGFLKTIVWVYHRHFKIRILYLWPQQQQKCPMAASPPWGTHSSIPGFTRPLPPPAPLCAWRCLQMKGLMVTHGPLTWASKWCLTANLDFTTGFQTQATPTDQGALALSKLAQSAESCAHPWALRGQWQHRHGLCLESPQKQFDFPFCNRCEQEYKTPRCNLVTESVSQTD